MASPTTALWGQAASLEVRARPAVGLEMPMPTKAPPRAVAEAVEAVTMLLAKRTTAQAGLAAVDTVAVVVAAAQVLIAVSMVVQVDREAQQG